jgi:hypothetical protein
MNGESSRILGLSNSFVLVFNTLNPSNAFQMSCAFSIVMLFLSLSRLRSFIYRPSAMDLLESVGPTYLTIWESIVYEKWHSIVMNSGKTEKA